MKIYKRNIDIKLYRLRFFFIATLFLCIYLFKMGFDDYGYLLSVPLFFCNIITVTGLRIDKQSFQVTKYFFFGLIPAYTSITKTDNINIYPFDIEPESDSDALFVDGGHWWDFLLIFLPKPILTQQKFIIDYTQKRQKKEVKNKANR